MMTASAFAQVYLGQRSAACELLEAAIDLDPNLAAAHSLLGQLLAMANRADDAIDHLQVALRLSPLDPSTHSFKTALGLAHFVRGDFQAMVHWCRSAVQDASRATMAHAGLACGYAECGDQARARDALRELLSQRSPDQSLRLLMASTDPSIAARFIAGLRKAGLSSSFHAEATAASPSTVPMY